MKVHPRQMLEQEAENELRGFLIDWMAKHDLTYAEAFRMLATAIASYCKLIIRDERK
jgi:hypothetical protein